MERKEEGGKEGGTELTPSPGGHVSVAVAAVVGAGGDGGENKRVLFVLLFERLDLAMVQTTILGSAYKHKVRFVEGQ